MEMEEKLQFAVLIDAENISARYAQMIFDELEKYGFASCRRIYGNWSKENGWKENILLEYSVTPIQQFSYTTGKTARTWLWSLMPWICFTRTRWTDSAW